MLAYHGHTTPHLSLLALLALRTLRTLLSLPTRAPSSSAYHSHTYSPLLSLPRERRPAYHSHTYSPLPYQVGDAIELTALKNVMGEGAARQRDPRRERCAVGSIKSQIGHLKAVAGAAGMLKVVLALKHKVTPPHPQPDPGPNPDPDRTLTRTLTEP